MFEEMWDAEDLEYTENRLRVHVLSLKRAGDPYPLLRLYGPLSLVLALRGKHLAAQDALNDAEFLIVEHSWRGTEKEAWAMCDRARTMKALGLDKFARRSLLRAQELAPSPEEAKLGLAIEAMAAELQV